MIIQTFAVIINYSATKTYARRHKVHRHAHNLRSADPFLTLHMLFGIPIGVRNDTKVYPLTPLAILLFKTAPHTYQCHMSDYTPRTKTTIPLSLNIRFGTPPRVSCISSSKEYGSLDTARFNLYLRSCT